MTATDKTYCEHYRDGLPFCPECEAGRIERLEQLQAKLAEARAEIERLALLAQNQQIVIDAQSRSIQAKDAQIEQIREALKSSLKYAEAHATRTKDKHVIGDVEQIKAALSAAKRGE